jgi:predicted dehydrogenase
MSRKFRWGIIGLGKIAHKFAEDIKLIEDAELYAVASTSKDRAIQFAEKFQVDLTFNSYEELVKSGEVDAVYIATAHTGHCENTLMCLENKVPVLCEKPFAMNTREVSKMIDAARENQTFLMEALWTQFIPAYQKMQRTIRKGMIGKVVNLRADFSFKAPFMPDQRVFNRDLGGGALLDIGIYPVFFALSILGKPEKIKALATFGKSQVDENCFMIFQYPDDQMAILDCSFKVNTNVEAYIYGEKGTIFLPTRFHHPTKMLVELYSGEAHEISIPYQGNGYYHEALEVMSCVRNGKKESEWMPLSKSLELIETLDWVRKEAGIIYPKFD